MAFFNDLGKKFSGLTEKTKDSVESMRLGNEARSLGNECEKLYTQYGRLCYALKNGEGSQEEADAVAAKIGETLERIKAINAQKDLLNAVVRCPECGAVQPKGSRFCSSCGTKIPEEAPKPQPALMPHEEYCTGCGALREPDSRFCTVCGKPFDAPAPAPSDAPKPAAGVDLFGGADVEEPVAIADAGDAEGPVDLFKHSGDAASSLFEDAPAVADRFAKLAADEPKAVQDAIENSVEAVKPAVAESANTAQDAVEAAVDATETVDLFKNVDDARPEA